jgi:hypothetical protein
VLRLGICASLRLRDRATVYYSMSLTGKANKKALIDQDDSSFTYPTTPRCVGRVSHRYHPSILGRGVS